jgi:hypothetical protein
MKTMRVRSLKAVLDVNEKASAPTAIDHMIAFHLEPRDRKAAVTTTTNGKAKFEKAVK